MAESAMSLLLEKLGSLDVEYGSRLMIRDEVMLMTAELRQLNLLLRDADASVERYKELQVWVEEVQDIANDLEDALDEFRLRLAFVRRWRNGCCGFVHAIPNLMQNVVISRRFVSEMQSFKYRLTNMTELRRRYITGTPEFQLSLGQGGSSSSTVVVDSERHNRRPFATLVDEAELVGIDEPKEKLISLLLDSNSRLQVVSVVGMEGSGKTTLVRKVYNDASMKHHFELSVWLYVSASFRMEEILGDMICQLFGEIPQKTQGMNRDWLTKMVYEFLERKRWLVILDDVWSIEAWEHIRHALPNSNRGCRVVITTPHKDVAAAASYYTEAKVHTMKPLSAEESWNLFCRKVFWEDRCPPHLEEVCRDILEKCDGLPLAIVAMGGVLAKKQPARIEEWKMLRKSLESELSEGNMLESVERVLSYSYNELPYDLKICFLYLSIFPYDHPIECSRLIRLWMAEGFLPARRGEITIEEGAERYLTELINRHLIQAAETVADGRVKTCRINHLVHQICTSKASKRNLLVIADELYTRGLERVRRLAIHSRLANVPQGPQHRPFSKLRSLLVFGVSDPLSKSSLPILFNDSTRLLRVLDLRNASLETIPAVIFRQLHLRYLSLRGTKVKAVPRSIGNLENLETLDLKDTHVTVLPPEIRKLQRLRHLLVYRYDTIEGYQPFHFVHGVRMPERISGLVAMQKLCHVDASQGHGSMMARELRTMTQLRKLGIVNLRCEDGRALCSSIENMRELRSLAVGSAEEDEIVDVTSLSSPPPLLQVLHLRGGLEKIPDWVSSLHNLVKVYLGWSRLQDEPLHALQDLPNLLHIELHRAYNGEELFFRCGGFPRLKILKLLELTGLRQVGVEEGAAPQLEKLSIVNCEAIEEVPSGVQYLTNLKSLELDGVGHEMYRRLSRDGEDYCKIAHIPSVWIEVPKSRFK